jgi:hypothetical protein
VHRAGGPIEERGLLRSRRPGLLRRQLQQAEQARVVRLEARYLRP